jgi:hypothetical protein
MIFRNNVDDFHLFESYKERNLYYKIFAGYLFNEIIEGYDKRKTDFLSLIYQLKNDKQRFIDINNQADEVLNHLIKDEWNLTFDYHTAQIFREDKINDRGEMSDILLLTANSIVSFECKFLSNYSIEKDIYSVQERIFKFSKHFNRSAIQILLLKRDKWNYSKKILNRVYNESGKVFFPIIIVFWEDIAELIREPQVLSFLITQINRKLQIRLI